MFKLATLTALVAFFSMALPSLAAPMYGIDYSAANNLERRAFPSLKTDVVDALAHRSHLQDNGVETPGLLHTVASATTKHVALKALTPGA